MKLLMPLLMVVVLPLGWYSVLSIDEKCRECICANTKGTPGNASDCFMPSYHVCFMPSTYEEYCGPYDMSEQYWATAGSLENDFYYCMADWACANTTLDYYIHIYCTPEFVGHEPPCSCEEQTRIHHCGPYGLHTQDCDDAWAIFRRCLEN